MPIVTEHRNVPPHRRIHFVCPQHPDSRMATWTQLPDGFDYWEHPNPGIETWREEFVIATPVHLDEVTLARLTELGIRPPDGVDPNGREHRLVVFSCPRPSCRYQPKVDADQLTATLRRFATGSVPELTFTDVDQPSWRLA